jgi:hypothetical protein
MLVCVRPHVLPQCVSATTIAAAALQDSKIPSQQTLSVLRDSATWGGVIIELGREAAQRNDAIDKGMLYGLLTGAKGFGYMSGWIAAVPLLKAGSTSSVGSFGYGMTYRPLIIFTELLSVFGDWECCGGGSNCCIYCDSSIIL